MGLQMWLARRQVRGIIDALRSHYDEGRAMYPDLDLPSLCRDVIGSRYQIIKPDPKELAIIQEGIGNVCDIYDVAVLVVLAESNIPNGDGAFLANVIRGAVYEVARTEGVPHPLDDPNTRDKAFELIQKWKLVRLRAGLAKTKSDM